MRKVQFYGAISLDGYLATTDQRLDWLFQTAGGDEAPTEQFLQQVDTAIMGRHTYEYTMAETTDQLINPYRPETRTIVMTTAPHAGNATTQFTNTPVAELVDHLRREAGQSIWIVGGSGVLMPLITANLVDDLFIQIAPVILGSGIRLFTTSEQSQRYQLVNVTHYDQLAELHYQKQVAD
ncbi:dihydrofolate reductase family protein [Lactiplantibacillus modestisalitolerans]|uniref:Dihydrofolate reductase family protein n=1 Tax=Lactiplantibacillus modestisalitolerans TaxID=1457219 RepID=A0ABV5WR06_9LACO|nr:dihydrofolate reductase family protein [Lactiplantibacillus modestisalitolerans]